MRTINLYPCDPLLPLYAPVDGAFELPVNLAPSTTFERGRLLSLVGATQNEVHTLSDTPTITAGTFVLTYTHPLTLNSVPVSGLAYNVSNANLKTAIEAALGNGITVTIGGGTLPGTDTTITYGGAAAGIPVTPPTVDNTGLTGGSLAVTRTTIGRTAQTFMPYSSTLITAPTTAPTVAGNGSGSSFAAGTHLVAYTYVTALGESTPSIPAPVTLTAAQNIRVSAISSIATGVTKVRYYVNGVPLAETAVSSGTAAQTDISGGSLTLAALPAPVLNTAYYPASGITVPGIAICKYACTTDASGFVTFGSSGSGAEQGQVARQAPAYFGGIFATSSLYGLDALCVSAMAGRLLQGTVSSGVLSF